MSWGNERSWMNVAVNMLKMLISLTCWHVITLIFNAESWWFCNKTNDLLAKICFYLIHCKMHARVTLKCFDRWCRKPLLYFSYCRTPEEIITKHCRRWKVQSYIMLSDQKILSGNINWFAHFYTGLPRNCPLIIKLNEMLRCEMFFSRVYFVMKFNLKYFYHNFHHAYILRWLN